MRALHKIGEPRAPLAVAAKTRKRCPTCNRMVEVGDAAILTDDRCVVDNLSQNHGHAQYRAVRGAFHLYHPACHAEFLAWREAAAVRSEQERAEMLADLQRLRDREADHA